MTLEEILDYTIIQSGQIGFDCSELEIDSSQFKKLIEISLGIYNKYSPVVKQFNIDMRSRRYEFNAEGYHGIPVFLSDVIPVKLLGIYPYYYHEFLKRDGYSSMGMSEYLEVKQPFPWTYRLEKDFKNRIVRGILVVPIEAHYDIHAVYKHQITLNEDDITEEIATIFPEDRLFLDLVLAKFLKAIGRSRRSFVLNDIPITNDGSELYSEGESLEDKTLEELKENDSMWYLAY